MVVWFERNAQAAMRGNQEFAESVLSATHAYHMRPRSIPKEAAMLVRLRNTSVIIILTATIFLVSCATADAPPSFTSGRISVTTHGSGPDVVLVAGLDALASEVWGGVIERVPGYRYHVVQVAGFAGFPSGENAGDGPVIEPIAAEIARYVEESRLQKPAIVGLSLGGSLAMLVAARHPSLVSRVMVVDMVPFGGVLFGPPGTIRTSDDVRAVAQERRERMLTESEESRRKWTTAMVGEMIRTERLRESVVEHGLASDRSVSARAFSELIVLDLREELARFKGPLTVLYVHAPIIPLSAEATDKLYETSFAAVPRARLVRIPDAYHFIMLDQPERFARELVEFLE
jgi:pimeloyl-ACP methyl ester carboxylesterase